MNIKNKVWWRCIVVLLWVTLALRTWALDTVPPGLTHDEASNGHDSAAILRGVHRLYFPVGYGHEPLYNYSVALVTLLLGQSIFTLRLTSVGWSVLTWVLTVALARRWWGRRAALFTGAAITAGFWPLMMARLGLRATTLPPLLTASVLMYDHAITAVKQAKAWRFYTMAGLFLGASFYTYMASRGMLALYPAWLLILACLDRQTLRRVWPGTLYVTGVAIAVGAPLFLYLNAHPDLEVRIQQLGSALIDAKSGNFQPLLHNILDSLPMMVWRADPHWLYHISERPVLTPFLAIAFLGGILRAVLHLKDRRNMLLLLWLAGGLAPALLTSVDYNTLHAIAALPAVFLLITLGFEALWQSMRPLSRLTYILSVLLILGFLGTGIEASYAYFITWAQNRDVRVIYHHHIVTLGRHLDKSEAKTPVMITSMYPGEFHDPYTMEVTLKREDLHIRWVGQNALFFPKHQSVRLYTEAQSTPAPVLWKLMDEESTLTSHLTFRPEDIPTEVQGYTWHANTSWEKLLTMLDQKVQAAPYDPPPHPENPWLDCPVHYGNLTQLLGYQVVSNTRTNSIEILSAWEVQSTTTQEWTLFTHLLDANGTLITQHDQLDAPSWQWQAGDRFVQRHALKLPPDLPQGTYAIALGWYVRDDWSRAVIDIASEPATRVLIPLNVPDTLDAHNQGISKTLIAIYRTPL